MTRFVLEKVLICLSGFFLFFMIAGRIGAADMPVTSYADNYAVPVSQPGYAEQNYEGKSAAKLQRGLENFFMGFLEIPHGVKKEMAIRKADYLPMGIEPFFLGLGRGIGNTAVRMAVGFYEGVTFVYAQDPILEEMQDWAY